MRQSLLIVLMVVLSSAAYAAGQASGGRESSRPAERAGGTRSLLVLPIAPSPSGEQPWVGAAIQRDLTADFTQATRLRVVAPSSALPATDAQAALREARRASADYVLYGESQVSGAQMRVTGQVLDVNTGGAVGGLKATADVDDLFPMEDMLAMQAVRSLPAEFLKAPPPLAAPATQPAGASAAVAPLPSAEPQATSSFGAPPDYYSYQQPAPYSSYTYNTYYYPYPYPADYWGYSWYPWWGPDVLVFYDLDHDRHFHHYHAYGGRVDIGAGGRAFNPPFAHGFGRYGAMGARPGFGGGAEGGRASGGAGAHGGGGGFGHGAR